MGKRLLNSRWRWGARIFLLVRNDGYPYLAVQAFSAAMQKLSTLTVSRFADASRPTTAFRVSAEVMDGGKPERTFRFSTLTSCRPKLPSVF